MLEGTDQKRLDKITPSADPGLTPERRTAQSANTLRQADPPFNVFHFF